MQELRVRRAWPVVVVLALAYLITARLGLTLALPPDNKATAVWPPSGLALAAVLLFGRRVWPGVWVGALLANAWDVLNPDRGPAGAQALAAALIATGSTLQALAGRSLLRQVLGPVHPLDRAADVFRFVAVTAAACLVAPTVGAAVLPTVGLAPATAAPSIWWTWWLGDVVGVLVVAPVLLTLARGEPLARPDITLAERAGFMALLTVSCGIVFAGWWGLVPAGTPAAYAVLPLLVWPAFRFGSLCAAVALLLVCGFAVGGTVSGSGPFGPLGGGRAALLLAGFLAVAGVTVQVLRAALRERERAEDRFRQLAEGVPQLVWTARPDGAVDYFSPQWVAYTGVPAAGHLGFGWAAALHPDDRPAVVARWAESVARGAPVEVEARIRGADGAHRWFQARAVPLRDEAGRTTAWFGTCTDVDELKRTQAELRLILDTVPALIFRKDLGHRLVQVNEALVRAVGLPRAEIEGRTDSEVGSPHEAAYRRAEEEVLRDGRTVRTLEPLHTVGGTRWLDTTKMPYRDEGGRVVGVLGFAVDVTEQKRAEDEVRRLNAELERRVAARTAEAEGRAADLERAAAAQREQGRLLQAILDSLAEAVLVADTGGRVLLVNAAFRRFHPTPVGDAMGLARMPHLLELFLPDGSAPYPPDQLPIARAVRGESCDDVEVLVVNAAAPEGRAVSVTGRPVVGPNGIEGGVVAIRDVTAARRAATALRESEERYALVVRGSRDGIWDWNVRTGEVYYSARWKEQLGYAGDEVAPRVSEWERLLHPDDRPTALAALAAYFERRADGFGLEVRMAHKGGGFRWVYTRGEALWGADGRPDRMAGSHTDVTERKAAEVALRESEGRFRGAFDHAPIGVALVAPAGRWLKVNRALCGLLGYTPDELLATDFQTLTHTDDLNTDLDLVRRVLRGELAEYQMEKRYVRKDGGLVRALLSVSLVRDDRGAPLYFISQIQDITARKAAEAELRQGEERLAEAQRIARLGSWEWDPGTGRVWWSDVMYELFGVTPDRFEPTAEGFLGLLHPDDRGRAVARIQAVYAGADGFADDLRVVRPDGTLVWLNSLGRVTRGPDGAPTRVEGIDQDITERRAAEAALRASEQRYRDLVELSPDAIAIVCDGAFAYVNPAGAALFGRAPEDLLGRPLSDWLHPDDVPASRERQQAVTGEGRIVPLREFRLRQPDGSWRVVESCAGPCRFADRPAVQLIARDVTARKLAEEQLRDSEERLRLAVDVAELGVLTVDYATQAVRPSRRAAELFGFAPGEAVPRASLYDRVHPDDRAELERRVAGAYDPDGAGGFAMEFRLARGDGRTAWVNARKRVYFEGGARHRAVLVVADVTARKAAEERVRESEERLRLALEAARLGTFDWDLGTDRIVWSGTHYALFGYDPGDRFEVRFRHFADRLHPDDRERVGADIAVARDARRPYANEARIVLPDGTVRWVMGSGEFRYGPDGTPVRMLGTTLDITDRKRAEHQLQEANAILRAVTQVQREFLVGGEPRRSFDRMLALLLKVTDSEYGFIGEVLYRGNQPYLKTHAITNIAWDEQTRAFYDRAAPSGLEFFNLNSLFGAVLTSAAAVLANDPGVDPRRAGLPHGHPPLNAFLGLPFFQGDELIGMVGLANRPGGYDDQVVELLAPVLTTCSSLVSSHRLRGERARAEERFRAAMEGSLHAAYFLTAERDPKGVVTDFVFAELNRRGAELVGRPREQVLGRRLCELIPINRTGGFFDKYVKVLETGEPLEEEFAIARADGLAADWLRHLVVRTGDGVAITTQDVTERKRAEIALRDSEERFRAFMSYAPFAAWMVDEQTCGVYCSPGFERVTGLPPGALIGRTSADLFPPAVAAQHRANNLAVLTSGQPLEGEEDFVRADGTPGVALVVKFPLREGGGRTLVGGVAIDITERKRAEADVRASLQEKVVMLKEIHHRVKNNLQIITSLLDLQAAEVTDPGALVAFRETRGRVRSMALIHERLYRFENLARVEFGGYLRNLAEDLFRAYRADDEAIRLTVEVSVPPLPLDAAIPAGLLVNELVSNCLKYAFVGRQYGTIHVSLARDPVLGYILAVADDGVGLPPGFDPHRATSFGLQLVTTLADQLGGSLTVTGTGGTRFAVRFPARD